MNKKNEVINYIEENIKNGKWKEGSKIFSENQLIEYLGVSRVTIRLAINDLCKKGILETRQGSGTFIKGFNKNHGKYILIITNISAVTGDTNLVYRYYSELLKKYIKSLGYIPLLYVGNNDLDIEESLSSKLNEISGAIFLFGCNKDLSKINMLNIPCISCLGAFPNYCPSIVCDYTNLIYKINYLLRKYNLNDVIVFKLHPNNKKHVRDNLILLAIESFFSKYKIINVPISFDHNMKVDKFKNTMKNLTKTPDVIVFMDDTIYNTASPYFQKYDKILKNTKIITHSSGNLDIPDVYKICKLEFDLDKAAKETVNLLDKKINNIFTNECNIYIEAKIINENILK